MMNSVCKKSISNASDFVNLQNKEEQQKKERKSAYTRALFVNSSP